MNPFTGNWRYVLFYCIYLSLPLQAQVFDQDSLLNTYDQKTSFYYLKPIYGLHWTYASQQGDPGFTGADRFDLRHQRYGLAIGYRTGRFGIETGMTTLPVHTGYGFTSNDGVRIGGGVYQRYLHCPIQIYYTLWQANQHLQVQVLAGVAVNRSLGEDLFPSRLTTTFTSTNPNGGSSRIETVRNTHYRAQFGSATAGLSINYLVGRRVELNVQVNRLFSSTSILTVDVQLRQTNDPTLYQVSTKAGAGGLSTLMGIAYRFHKQNRFILHDKRSY